MSITKSIVLPLFLAGLVLIAGDNLRAELKTSEVAVDIGGTRTKILWQNKEAGRELKPDFLILPTSVVFRNRSPRQGAESLSALIASRPFGKLNRVVLSVAGNVDSQEGVILGSYALDVEENGGDHNLKVWAWKNFALAKELEKALACPVFILSDGVSAGLGAYRYRRLTAPEITGPILVMALGTAVAVSVVWDEANQIVVHDHGAEYWAKNHVRHGLSVEKALSHENLQKIDSEERRALLLESIKEMLAAYKEHYGARQPSMVIVLGGSTYLFPDISRLQVQNLSNPKEKIPVVVLDSDKQLEAHLRGVLEYTPSKVLIR